MGDGSAPVTEAREGKMDPGRGLALVVLCALGDLIGRKRIFLIGLTVFTSASLLCGLAQSQSRAGDHMENAMPRVVTTARSDISPHDA